MEITVTLEETINIELPIFYKKPKEQVYFAAISKSQAISFSTRSGYSFYSVGDLHLYRNEANEAYNNWEPITEEQFIDAHEDFLRLQSLQPVLIHKPNANDDLAAIEEGYKNGTL